MAPPVSCLKPGPDRPRQEASQPPLIPMSEAELKDASRELARLVGGLADLQAEHAQSRKEMRDEEGNIELKIAGLASTIRTKGR